MEPPQSPRIFKKTHAASRAPRVVSVLASLLERAAERGDADADADASVAASHTASASAAFRGKAVPGIPVRRYAERIYRYAGCSPACFVVAYVYLDRLALGHLGEDEEERGDGEGEGEGEGAGEEETKVVEVVGIDSYNVHRLLITSVLVAAKFMDDRHYNNAYFARVGGVELSEMNTLELRLLFALRFRLNVHPDTFARYCAALQGVMADDDPATAPLMTSTTVFCDDYDDEAVVVTTKAEKKGGTAGGGAGSAVPTVVGVHSHRHHHRGAVVVQIMTTAQ